MVIDFLVSISIFFMQPAPSVFFLYFATVLFQKFFNVRKAIASLTHNKPKALSEERVRIGAELRTV